MSPEVLRAHLRALLHHQAGGEGTGLGLSTSRNIIEGFGGSLTVQSTLGKGSTFRITLPAVHPALLASQPVPCPEAPKARKDEPPWR